MQSNYAAPKSVLGCAGQKEIIDPRQKSKENASQASVSSPHSLFDEYSGTNITENKTLPF